MIPEELPADLQTLFRGAEDAVGRRLSVALPDGRVVMSDEGTGGIAALWLSDGPATADLFCRIRADHSRSGLYPLLLDGLDKGGEEYRPWGSGELFHARLTSPENHDPAVVLARWWAGDDEWDEDDAEVTAPFDERWPGLAPAMPLLHDSDRLAEDFVRRLLAEQPYLRLGLVAATGGATALTAAGWSGPVNQENDTALFSAVVGDWERRFGARVVCVGFDTLRLSVAAPPTTRDAALAVAAEHMAFCPDNIWQGIGTLSAYADALVNAEEWYFWWD